MLGPGRRDAEAAIADHYRGDAMPGRDGEHGIPQHLRVVVRVDVDEARRYDLTAGIDGAKGLVGRMTQRHDLAVLDADVAAVARGTGAVDDLAARDLQVIRHGLLIPP